MKTKKIIGVGLLMLSLIIYNITNFKVGPCSPEIELNMNKDK